MSQKTINWIVGIVILIIIGSIGSCLEKCNKGDTIKHQEVSQKQEEIIQKQEEVSKYASWTSGSSNKFTFMLPPGFKVIENTSDSDYDITTISGGTTDNSEVFKIQYTKDIIGEAIPYATAVSLVLLDITNDFKSKGFEVDFKDAKMVAFGANTLMKWTSNYEFCNVYFGSLDDDVISIITITNNSTLARDFLEALKVK